MWCYLRVGSRDVFIQALVVVDGVLKVLQLGGQIHLAARLAPGVHVTHVLQGKTSTLTFTQTATQIQSVSHETRHETVLYTSLYSSKESHVSQTYQSVQEIAWGAFFYTITELKQEEMSFHMVMSSLKTLSEELFMAECAVHWPVMTSWNFLYPHVGGEEKQTNQRGGPQRNIRKLVVSLLLITGIRYRKGTKVYNGFLSICGGEKVGAKPLGKKKSCFYFSTQTWKAGLMTAVFQVGKDVPPMFPSWDSAWVLFQSMNHSIVSRLMSADRNNSR